MFSPQCLVCSIPCILMFRQPTARREVRKNNDCAESELANHLSPEVKPFPKFVCSGSASNILCNVLCVHTCNSSLIVLALRLTRGDRRTQKHCLCTKHTTDNQDTTHLTFAHITLSRESFE